MKQLKYSLFYIGIFIFSITSFLEHLYFGETNITCFFKGLACGLELVGGIVLILKHRKDQTSNS